MSTELRELARGSQGGEERKKGKFRLRVLASVGELELCAVGRAHSYLKGEQRIEVNHIKVVDLVKRVSGN